MHTDYRKWEVAIEDWQQPVLRDESLPEWCVQMKLVLNSSHITYVPWRGSISILHHSRLAVLLSAPQ
jgi:hypothetical protein